VKRLRPIAWLVVFGCMSGCSSGLVRLTGQVEDNGQPVRLNTGETLQLDFVSAAGASLPLNLGIPARPDGSFVADMNDGTGNGLPPGKYMVKLNRESTNMTRKLDAKLFKNEHSVDVVAGVTLHIKVDLTKGTIGP
jgi:hypothetical protein